jgi:hypothetical protein
MDWRTLMAKRFTDTEIWKKKWYRELPLKMKETWRYLIENCNHGGIWEVDIDLMSFQIGTKISKAEITEHLGDKIQVLNSGSKWYLPKFVSFQYGELNPNVKAHQSVINIHKKYNLTLSVTEPLSKGLESIKDKDKVKVKVEDKEKDKEFDKFWNLYEKKVGNIGKIRVKWDSLSRKEKLLIFEHLPKYKKSTPDKQYRKDPMTYLNNQSWNDEIIQSKGSIDQSLYRMDTTGFPMAYCEKCNKGNSYRWDELGGESRCCNADLHPKKLVLN